MSGSIAEEIPFVGLGAATLAWKGLSCPFAKVARLDELIHHTLLADQERVVFPDGFLVGRKGACVLSARDLPAKPGLNSPAGKARLLHDLASIELQAMELAVRSLGEFPEAPRDFRLELAEVALSEGRHLRMCLDHLQHFGFAWGDWPVHLALWQMVGPSDSLLDRILIVHRYLEGSGLDAGASILRRLIGTGERELRKVVGTIVEEEVQHVRFGSFWFRRIAELFRQDPERVFAERMPLIALRAPRRERLDRELRRASGFTEAEILFLERENETITNRHSIFKNGVY